MSHVRSRFLTRIAAMALLFAAWPAIAAEDAPPPKNEAPPAPKAEAKKPMKTNEPMTTEMKKPGMMKGDVKKAAEKKDGEMKGMMEKEEKEMKK